MTKETIVEASSCNPTGLANVHIRDEAQLKEKLTKIKLDGLSKLSIITDFDMTITKYWVNSKRNFSSHSILKSTNLLSESFKAEEERVLKKYYPIEIDSTLDPEYKFAMMEEWWNEAHEMFIKEKLPYQGVKEAIEQTDLVYREGALELLNFTKQYKVPTLVFSAGIANIIELLLKKQDVIHPALNIISNHIIFESEPPHLGTSFTEPIIHVLNKGSVNLNVFPIYSKLQNISNYIVIGDSLGDKDMGETLTKDLTLKIGLLNLNVEKDLDLYMQHFDVVLTYDAPLTWLNQLLNTLV